MGVPAPVPKGPRRPSAVPYYVALFGILALLAALCLYFFYFFIKKIKQLSSVETQHLATASCRPAPAAAAYPVQPVVRESATAMATLCRQAPPGKKDTVFPAASSPAALRASTGDTGDTSAEPATPATVVEPPSTKAPAPVLAATAILEVPVQ